MKNTFSVRDLPALERPRERIEHLGPAALSLAELLSIILGRGVRNQPVAAVAGKLLSQFPSLSQLAEASLADFRAITGLGQAKAAGLVACFELARRLMHSSDVPEQLTKSVTASGLARTIRGKIRQLKKEHSFVASFDTRNRIIGIDQVSLGTLTANLVHPRETFDAAIKRHAAYIIVCHNHPSGDVEPSDEDLAVTQRLVTAGKIIGIEVNDHIIVSTKEHFSFKEKNLL